MTSPAAVAASATGEVSKEGFLMKQGGSIKTWKRRWFILKGSTLFYYKEPASAKPKGFIQTIGEDGNAYEVGVAANNKKEAGKHFCFFISTPKRRYLCWANSGAEMDAWINIIIDAQIKSKAKPPEDPQPLPEKKKKKKKKDKTPEAPPPEEPSSERSAKPEEVVVVPEGSAIIVIDNGSGWIRAGFSTQRKPAVAFPTVVSTFGDLRVIGEYCLSEAEMKKECKQLKHRKRNDNAKPELRIEHPIERGIIQDWEAMEDLWGLAFEKLKIDPKKYTVLLSEPPLNPKQNTEKMAQIMFEKFGVQDLYITGQAVLSLYSVGKSTGVVVSVGDGVTFVVPIYEGFTVESSVKKLPLGGNDLTDQMMKLLKQRGYTFNTDLERELVREIKEKSCYVALDFETETKNANADRRFNILEETTVVLREKRKDNVLVLGSERYYCPEVLFKPALVGLDVDGIVGMIYESVQSCGIDLRRSLYENIVLSGGSSMFPGFAERVEREISEKVTAGGSNIKPKVWRGTGGNLEDRAHTVWLGGATLAALDTFEDMCLPKEDYDELGVAAIHDKFKGL